MVVLSRGINRGDKKVRCPNCGRDLKTFRICFDCYEKTGLGKQSDKVVRKRLKAMERKMVNRAISRGGIGPNPCVSFGKAGPSLAERTICTKCGYSA